MEELCHPCRRRYVNLGVWVTLVMAVEPVSHNFPVSFGAEQSLRLIHETKFISSSLQDTDSKR